MNTISSLDKILKIGLLIFLIILLLYFAQKILIPITIASLLSFLFLPLVNRLEKLGLGKIIPIVICILMVLVVIFGLIFLFSSQLMDFTENIPALESEARKKFHAVLKFIESATHIPYLTQREWIAQMNASLDTRKWLQNIFFVSTDLMLNLGIILVYIFCFLYYKHKFSAFFISLSPKEKQEQTKNMMLKIQHLSSHYFSGVLIVMIILGTMHSIGLYLLGIEHPIFLGYMAGMFILVPIFGTMIGSIIPIFIALVTKDSVWYAIGVSSIFCFNLFIESQILTPTIVGSHIKINPMAIIIAIVIGGFIWGLPGMVLFIPLLGMLKILSDNIESLYPIKILLSADKKEKSVGGLQK